ncbi:MAG: PepSY domain-containing protein [Armatimonadota bacterium]|nr:PepSY domain-containing protein [Armatimonadota bacterium]
MYRKIELLCSPTLALIGAVAFVGAGTMAPASAAPSVCNHTYARTASATVHLAAAEENDEKDGDKEEDDAPVDPASVKVTPENAKKAARTAKPGNVTGAKLEKEDGTVVYEVKIAGTDNVKYEVTVDANSGKVLKSEVDDEKNETGEHED